jgi:hypothetical protein
VRKLLKQEGKKKACLFHIIKLVEGVKPNLDDMVPEINFFPFFSGSVFYIEHANEICCPAPQQPVEELKEYARQHSQLGK